MCDPIYQECLHYGISRRFTDNIPVPLPSFTSLFAYKEDWWNNIILLELKDATGPSYSSSYLNMLTRIGGRCKFLNCLPFYLFQNFPLTSCPFLSIPALYYPFQSVERWMDGRTKGTHGCTDGWKDGTHFLRCLQEKQKRGVTHEERQTPYYRFKVLCTIPSW